MLEIIYQDEHCVVVNKPAGMLVHRSWLDSHETVFVMQTLRDQLGQYVYPVHRLDRPTSGVLLFGLSSESARLLCQQFEQNLVRKSYLAVVRGYLHLKDEKGELQTDGLIDYPLKQILDKIGDKPTLQNLELDENDEEKGKSRNNPSVELLQSAQTLWQCLATTEQPFQARPTHPTSRYSLAKLTPITGRKHQLRRHMKHIYHPIIGDTSYGDHHQNRAIRQNLGIHRLMLHAHTLSFRRLSDNQSITVNAAWDDDWVAMVKRFEFGSALNDRH